MTVKKSVFERNRAVSGEGGGAVFNQNSADARIIASTISRNTAVDAGGGIFVKNQSDMTVVNSTVSGNRADSGGGIFVGQQAHINLLFTTVADNTALSVGGGVFEGAEPPGPPSPPYLTLHGTIVAGNHAPGGSDDNCFVSDTGNWLSDGGNLDDDGSCPLFAGSDQPDANAGLRKLARNGGPTKTHALKPSSDAVNAAPKQGCPKRDQRGVKRPQGNRCDAGSYELKRR
jgi:parallel beta-helix repeat protein